MNFDFLAEDLLNNALEEFRATEQNKLMREKLAQMDLDCLSMFQEEERMFAEECFETLQDAEEAKTKHAYQKGLLDSVGLLKWLGVLA